MILFLYTSFLNPRKYSLKEIAALYQRRWNTEVDLRSLKTHLNMDVLRCKSPEMVEKEIWIHMLTYNMIRAVMLEAAQNQSAHPRQRSFKEAQQLFSNYRMALSTVSSREWDRIFGHMRSSITTEVRNRPNRLEPRLVKHNPLKYKLLKKERSVARLGFWKKGWTLRPDHLIPSPLTVSSLPAA